MRIDNLTLSFNPTQIVGPKPLVFVTRGVLSGCVMSQLLLLQVCCWVTWVSLYITVESPNVTFVHRPHGKMDWQNIFI